MTERDKQEIQANFSYLGDYHLDPVEQIAYWAKHHPTLWRQIANCFGTVETDEFGELIIRTGQYANSARPKLSTESP